jgi:hypothetical protein
MSVITINKDMYSPSVAPHLATYLLITQLLICRDPDAPKWQAIAGRHKKEGIEANNQVRNNFASSY